MYNGIVQTMGPNTWTLAVIPFVVDDPEGAARIDPMPHASFNAGNNVTVEFDHVGEILPDNANWAPLTLDAGTHKWTGMVDLPAVSAVRPEGFSCALPVRSKAARPPVTARRC